MKEKFIDHTFRKDRQDRIRQANEIIAEYQEQGFTLSARQLYYQFVARDLIPNKQSEYKKLADAISDARKAGLIDWDAIEDRTRYLRGLRHFDSPGEAVDVIAGSYHTDLWEDQRFHVEVFCEKDALISLIEETCVRYDVSCFSCRGYASDSALYDAGKRFKYMIEQGKFDALEPSVLSGLVSDAIERIVDADAFNKALERQYRERALLTKISRNWKDIEERFSA